MNNGRPPYGSQQGWNPQGMQGYGAQQGYNPQQPQSNQINPQTNHPMNQQPVDQQQSPYAGYAGFGQQNPQQGWQQIPQQGYSQQGYSQQGFSQTGYQQQVPQQGWQQMPPQGYAQPQNYTQQQFYQQPYPPQQNASAQWAAMQQQQQPQASQQSSYIGYQPPKNESVVSPEMIVLLVIGAVLPVLFILGLVLPGASALKWVFFVLTLVMIAYIWVRPVVQSKLRFILSLVGGVMAVIALVSALTGTAPSDPKNSSADGVQSAQSSNVGGGSGGNGASAQGNQSGSSLPSWSYTDAPPSTPTSTPAAPVSAAQQQLESFLYFWAANNYESMLPLTAPSWRRSQENPHSALFLILANRTPVSYQIIKVGGTENDTSRQIKVRMEIYRNNQSSNSIYLYDILMYKEDGVWYVNPPSLKSNERESTPAPTNSLPTQPPVITAHPNLVLYYNPDGGTQYHVDPYCSSAAKAYLPFKGSFTWSQINSGDYAKLKYCNVCNAPLREN